MKKKTRIKFMNIEIDNLSMEEALREIDSLIKSKSSSYVVTPNVDHIIKLETDTDLQKIYKNAALVLTDGKPLLWISKLYGTPITEKISGSDLFPKLCKLAESKGYSMFFLGAAEGVAAKAAQNLRIQYPKLNVCGVYSPSMGFEKNQVEMKQVLDAIKKAAPDILIVGLGCPKQEKFIYKYRDVLNVPISLGLGASLDFEAGNVKRAPQWMSNAGLEWFFRMCQDPRRLMKRYLVDDIKIIKYIRKYRPNY